VTALSPRTLRLVALLAIAVAVAAPPAAQAGGGGGGGGRTAVKTRGARGAKALTKMWMRPAEAWVSNTTAMLRIARTTRQRLTQLRTEDIRATRRPQDLARLMARGASPGELRFVHAHASDPRTPRTRIDRTGSVHFGPGARARLARGKRVKALLVAHGYTSNADQQRGLDDLASHADALGMAVVYIDGIEAYDRQLHRNVRSWNAGKCCGPAIEHGFRDLEFIAELLPELGRKFHIAGWAMAGESNGGYLTYKARRELPRLIHAAFPVVGTEEEAAGAPAEAPEHLPPLHATVGRGDMLVNPMTARLLGALAPEQAAEQAAREKGATDSRTRRVLGSYVRTTWREGGGKTVGSVTKVTAVGLDHHMWPGGAHTSKRIAKLADQLIPDAD
jgi:poly(3-hydroxybutyrate) depolymerase